MMAKRTQILCDTCGADVGENEYVSFEVPYTEAGDIAGAYTEHRHVDMCTKCLELYWGTLVRFTILEGSAWLKEMDIRQEVIM